jgi:hypothetical protein
MAKANNTFERNAAKAAERIAKAHQMGEQLALLPDEAGRTPQDVAEGRKVGRPKGAANKGSSQMREWLAAQGYRMPEQQLAQLACLDGSGDLILSVMQRTEQMLAWAYADAAGTKADPKTPTSAQRLAQFNFCLGVALRAADALLPYGAPKATPDVAVQQITNVIVPSTPEGPGDRARVVDVAPAQKGNRMRPAGWDAENQQNQSLSKGDPKNSDGETRTGKASD